MMVPFLSGGYQLPIVLVRPPHPIDKKYRHMHQTIMKAVRLEDSANIKFQKIAPAIPIRKMRRPPTLSAKGPLMNLPIA
jgi:hypothetical protein